MIADIAEIESRPEKRIGEYRNKKSSWTRHRKEKLHECAEEELSPCPVVGHLRWYDGSKSQPDDWSRECEEVVHRDDVNVPEGEVDRVVTLLEDILVDTGDGNEEAEA